MKYVRNYKFDELLGVLSRIPEENKQDVLGVATPEGLTCFHYAVQLEETSYSNPILEALVECSPGLFSEFIFMFVSKAEHLIPCSSF